MTEKRYNELFVAAYYSGFASITEPVTDEDKQVYAEILKERTESDVLERRDRHIYTSAITESGIDWMNPPPTSAEKALYKARVKDMRETEANAEAEGRTITWDVPFDP